MELLVAAFGAGGVLSVIITTFGPSLIQAVKYGWQEHQGRAHKIEAAHAAATIHHILNDAVVRLGAKRAMIIFTENGGGVPKPGHPIFVTIMFEMFRNIGQSIRHIVQRVQCDGFYCDMIHALLTNETGKIYLITEKMPNCYLKNVYNSAGTKSSIVIYLRSTKRKTYYASFNFPHDQLTDDLDRELDLLAHQLKSIYSKI